METIELTEEVPHSSWRKRLFIFAAKHSIKIAAVLIAAWYLGQWEREKLEWLTSQYYQKRAVVLESLKLQDAQASTANSATKNETIKELIIRVAREENVSPVVVLAMAHRESTSQLRTDLMRYEEGVYLGTRGRKPARGRHGAPDSEIDRMWSKSLGVMQVIPHFHAERCGLTSYAPLLVPEVNIRCGIRALKDCLKRNDGDFHSALICYNGGADYANAIMGRIGEFAVKEFKLIE